MEQQSALRAWQAGGYKGLLSDPDLPSINLSEASTVVFLSPQLNSGLAFTGVKFAPYMAGSALGIPAQLVLAVFLLDFLLGGDGTTGASPPPPPLG